MEDEQNRVKASCKKDIPETLGLKKFRLQKGMKIKINGSDYKVTAARPNGKVTMKLMGK